jgi:uncharacterized coiled-coil DUF342 family protein
LFHVEQIAFNKNFVSERYFWLVATAFLLLATGCESVDPNPELKDPIYNDLKATLEATKEDRANAQTFKQMAKDELKILETGDPEIATLNKDIRKENKKIKAYSQKIRYLEIRLERRRLESRLTYAMSLNGNTEFPDNREYAAYQAHKKLRNASSNWNERVPRLKERIDQYIRKMNGEAEPEKKGDSEPEG